MDLDPDSRDLMTRAVLAEAGDQPPSGQAGVAHVILNRLNDKGYGRSVHDIVLGPHQFSPKLKSTDPRDLIDFDPNSKGYKSAAAIVDGAASGDIADPTNGATHFLAPGLMKGKLPSWATNQTAQIGGHNFYAPNAKTASAEPDLLGQWSTAPSSGAQSAPASSEPDLLGSWGGAAPAANAAPGGPLAQKPDETPGETTARWLSEHQGSSLTDRAARLGTGAMRGIGDVADTLAQGIGYAGEKGANALSSAGIISPESAANVAQWHGRINSDIAHDNALWNATAQSSPLAKVGQVAGEVAGSAPMVAAAAPEALLGAGGRAALAARPLLRSVLGGAAAGGETSALTSATSDDPLLQQVATGATVGGGLGPVGYGIGKGVNALAHISGIDKATAQLADMARSKFGIPVGPGQMSGSPGVRFLDSVLQRTPLSGHAADVAQRQTAFNRAGAATMGPIGHAAGDISPATMAGTKAFLSNEFETTLPKLEAHLNPDLQSRIQSITDATDYLPAEDGRIINKLKDDVLRQFTGVSAKPGAASRSVGAARMDGGQIQAMIAKGGTLDRAINGSSPNVSHYASELKEALMDAVGQTPTGRAKTAVGYVQNLQRYQQARQWYKNMKTLEPLAEKSVNGDISPALLMNQVRQSYGNMAYGGGGDLADLARIGQRFLKEPPSSGTSERAAAMYGLVKAGGAVAGLGGAYALDPEDFQRNALLGAGVLAGGRGVSSVLRSHWLANALIRNAPGQAATPFAGNIADRFRQMAPAAAVGYRNSRPGPTFDERFRGNALQ